MWGTSPHASPAWASAGPDIEPVEDWDRLPPDAYADAVAGSYRWSCTLVIVADTDAGTVRTTLPVTAGTLSFAADRIPQWELRADVAPETDVQREVLTELGWNHVIPVLRGTALDGTTLFRVPMPVLWLQRVTTRVDEQGERVSIDAVDIMGRLSDNGLTAPVRTGGSVRQVIRQLVNSAGHHVDPAWRGRPIIVSKNDDVVDETSPQRGIYDGDPIAGAAELADHLEAVLMAAGARRVRLVKSPTVAAEPFQATTVTAYQTVRDRAPTKVVVETSSTGGGRDVRKTAGGTGPGRYGTVTRTFYRADMSPAAATKAARGLLRRTRGTGYRVEEIEMLPNPGVAFGQTWQVAAPDAPPAGVVWAFDLPLTADQPMRLRMRTPEQED